MITTALVGPSVSDSASTTPYASVWTAVTEYTLPIDAQVSVGLQAGIVYVLLVAPEIAPSASDHWYVKVPIPSSSATALVSAVRVSPS